MASPYLIALTTSPQEAGRGRPLIGELSGAQFGQAEPVCGAALESAVHPQARHVDRRRWSTHSRPVAQPTQLAEPTHLAYILGKPTGVMVNTAIPHVGMEVPGFDSRVGGGPTQRSVLRRPGKGIIETAEHR
jgi:hypothetical protein